MVKAVCKLGLDMQRLSMRKTEQTPLSELYYAAVTGTGRRDDKILFFDKTLFTRKRAVIMIICRMAVRVKRNIYPCEQPQP